MKYTLVALLAVLVFGSCQNDARTAKNYFDIDSLIDRQLDYLNGKNATLTKSATIGRTADKVSFKPDSSAWAKELQVFRHLDIINKPIYTGAYKVTDGVKDANSNLIIKSFVTDREIPVKSLRLYYQGTPKKLRKVEATLGEQNTLYYTTRDFTMELEDIGKQWVIAGYEVKGVQKMILRDSVRFAITSKVAY